MSPARPGGASSSCSSWRGCGYAKTATPPRQVRRRTCGRGLRKSRGEPSQQLAGSGSGLPALLDLGCLAAQVAQVVQLRAADVTTGDDLDLLEDRGVQRERALDTDADGDLADGERAAHTGAVHADHDALEDLDAGAVALDDLDVDLDGVTGAEGRDVVALDGVAELGNEVGHVSPHGCHRSAAVRGIVLLWARHGGRRRHAPPVAGTDADPPSGTSPRGDPCLTDWPVRKSATAGWWAGNPVVRHETVARRAAGRPNRDGLRRGTPLGQAHHARLRLAAEAVAGPLVHPLVAQAAGAGEQRERRGLGRYGGLDALEEHPAQAAALEVGGDHQPTDLPGAVEQARAHSPDQPAGGAGHEDRVVRDPGAQVVEGLEQRRDLDAGVVLLLLH